MTLGGAPRSVGIVGAGIVGLSTAWFLQERGIDVTILEGRHPGAGASQGNAGWVSPGLTTPLPEPSVLAYGLRSLLERDAPFRVPPGSLLRSAPFLLAFARSCTAARFRRGLAGFEAISPHAFAAFEMLAEGGVDEPVVDSPIVAAFEGPKDASALEHELGLLSSTALKTRFEVLSGPELRRLIPLLSERARYGIRLEDQGLLDPARYVAALAEAVVGRGAQLETRTAVTGVASGPNEVRLLSAGRDWRFDAVVLSSGAWLTELARTVGVRVRVAAGRGYSVRVETDVALPCPLYLPTSRVACSPQSTGGTEGTQMRLAGTMEIAGADDRLDPRRIEAILASSRRLFSGAVHLGQTSHEWVGPRPITTDGLPLIGRSAQAGVYVAGGHGMWGVTLGPVTGRLLAEAIAEGTTPPALAGFDPCRRG